jgi:hypothetical protein
MTTTVGCEPARGAPIGSAADALAARPKCLLPATWQLAIAAARCGTLAAAFQLPLRPLAAPPSFPRAPMIVAIVVATSMARSSMMAAVLTLLIMMGMLIIIKVAMLAMLISMTIVGVMRTSWRWRSSSALRLKRVRRAGSWKSFAPDYA